MRFEPLEDRLTLTVLTVTSLADGPVNLTDATVTLRDALEAANLDLFVSPGGAKGNGADEIRFQAGLGGTITLTQGQIGVRSSVTITGPGANLLVVSGNNSTRVFDVYDPTGDRTVALTGMTIAGGSDPSYHGGGLINRENLTITGCTIRDNFAGFNGGGVMNFATLTVDRSTISTNSVGGDGGGIYNLGVLTLQNSTVSGNVANFEGGGIANFGGATLVARNSTITRNLADADNNGTGAGNGIFFKDTTVTLHNTIVADNDALGRHTQIRAFNGAVNAVSSNNLIGGEGYGGVQGGVNGNQVGVNLPGLGPLANNGGPTLTHALLITSPAFNAGNIFQAAGATDQRGGAFARIAYGTVDIGAFEFQPANVVDTNIDENDGNYAPGDLSLREAIVIANTLAGADVITFSPAFFNTPRVITLTLGQLELRSDLTITGPGANLLTVSGNDMSRVFDVSDLTLAVKTVAISGLTISAGRSATFSGGGILNREHLTVRYCTISGNMAGGGGGIYTRGTATLQNNTVSSNNAYGYGGGIRNGGILTAQNCTISQNHARNSDSLGFGGGIADFTGSLTLRNTIVADNYLGGGTGVESNVYHSTSFSLPIFGTNNLFGTGDAGGFINGVDGNQVGVADPGLGPLANNGGPTMTHKLLAGSLAINKGDPNFEAPPAFDQRGAPFARVAGGRLDVGAYEEQSAVAPSANFDGDSDVDGADFLRWQRGFGTAAPNGTKAIGDADNDLDVDAVDLTIWKNQFGGTGLATVAASQSSAAAVRAVDAVFFSAADLASAVSEAPFYRPMRRFRLRR